MKDKKHGRLAGIINRILRRASEDDTPAMRLGYNSEDRTHYDPTRDTFRKLVTGDMVTAPPSTGIGLMVGQVVSIDHRLIVAPLYHMPSDYHYHRGIRAEYMPHEVRLLLAPPLPPTGTPLSTIAKPRPPI